MQKQNFNSLCQQQCYFGELESVSSRFSQENVFALQVWRVSYKECSLSVYDREKIKSYIKNGRTYEPIT